MRVTPCKADCILTYISIRVTCTVIKLEKKNVVEFRNRIIEMYYLIIGLVVLMCLKHCS